jgi:GST-like protein
MADLSNFEITKKWPASNPDIIQFYSLPTPNGIKISMVLEELGLEYEPHFVNFGSDDQMSPEFISLGPNNKIPAIIDPNGPDGEPIGIFESGAILLYLAEKTGKLIPADATGKLEVLQWLMFQMGGVGPMFGQLGFFHKFAGADWGDDRPRDRYANETKRLLGVLDKQLEGQDWICGEFSIADIATFPWIATIKVFYEASDLVELDSFTNVTRAMDAFLARPSFAKARATPSKPA